MSRTLTLTLSALALCCGWNVASAQEKLSPSSVAPGAGVVTELGGVELNFAEVPAPNPDCGELAVMKKGDEVIASIPTDASAKLQQGVEGQPVTAILLVFSQTKITGEGSYSVIIPEGFLKFGDGTKVNEEITVEYTIPGTGAYMVEPAPGYFSDGAPTDVTIIFPGVKEIVDNHQRYDSTTGEGGVRFHTLTATKTNFVIEGNTLSFHVSDEPIKSPGEYSLVIWQGALTFVYEDGRRENNGYIKESYIKPVIPFPTLSFVREDGDVYEIGDFSMILPEGSEFTRFMRPPSLYTVTETGKKNARIASWTPVKQGESKNTYEFKCPYSEPYNVPGDYMFIIGKSSFEAKGPYYDSDYYGTLDTSAGGDDLSGLDPYEGMNKGDVVRVWNSCDYIYRVSIAKSPAAMETDLPATVGSITSFNISFPGAKTLALNPDCSAPVTIRDEYWRLQKDFTVSVDIVKSGVEPGIETLEEGAGCSAVMTVNPEFTKKGVFDIEIPAEMFICNGEIKSHGMVVHVTVDPTVAGVAGPEAEENVVNVFTVAGVQVVRDGRMSDLMKLPAGLYIINGRPTMLR